MPSNSADLRRRLDRLGRRPAKPSRAEGERPPAEQLPDGVLEDTPFGEAYVVRSLYPANHVHGQSDLGSLFAFEPALAAEVAHQPGLASIPIDEWLFLDTETTGLAGGAGTLVFLIGVGRFAEGQFELRQYFLRDPAEEPAMLDALRTSMKSGGAFVTFNGRNFDIPLIETRYTVGLRQAWPLSIWPNLDLLHPSRRLWSRGLPNCRLATIEELILGVRRTEQDVPGAEIPGMYLDYLRTGEANDMLRVVYHNAIDILSLVTLAERIFKLYAQEDPGLLRAEEALALARWHQSAGRQDPAEAAFESASTSRRDDIRIDALRRFAGHLKREGRYDEAVEKWEAWSALAPDDPRPCVELAKVYEWRIKDLEKAQEWAQVGMITLTHWPPDWRRERAWGELEHRLARLSRKMERQ